MRERAIVSIVGCPTCERVAAQPCVTKSGKQARAHKARRVRAEDLRKKVERIAPRLASLERRLDEFHLAVTTLLDERIPNGAGSRHNGAAQVKVLRFGSMD